MAELKELDVHKPVLAFSNGFHSLTTFVHKLEHSVHVHWHCSDSAERVQVQTFAQQHSENGERDQFVQTVEVVVRFAFVSEFGTVRPLQQQKLQVKRYGCKLLCNCGRCGNRTS